MKDLNGIEIKKSDQVIVPEPNETDIHNHSFIGHVSGFRNQNVIVCDDKDAFEFEPERLKVCNRPL